MKRVTSGKSNSTLNASEGSAKTAILVVLLSTLIDHFSEGNERYLKKDYQSAVASYQEAIRLHPDFGFAWVNLALALGHLDQNSVDASLAAYEEAISLMPHRARTYFNLGSALASLFAWDDAVSWMRRAVEHAPHFPAATLQIGHCLREAGKIKQALQVYQKMLRADPCHIEARSSYCYLLLVQQNEAGAEACFQEVLAQAPDHVDSLVQMAKMAHRRHNMDRAMDLYDRVLGMDYYHSDALFSQAVLQHRPVSRPLLHKYVRDHFDRTAFHHDATAKHNDYDIRRRLLRATLGILEGPFARCRLRNTSASANAYIGARADASCSTDDCKSGSGSGGAGYSSGYDEGCVMAEFGFHDRLVLDVGCGTGLLCEDYRQDEADFPTNSPVSLHFYGIDISEGMVARARVRDCYNRVANFEVEDFLSAFHGESFDVVLAADTIPLLGPGLEGLFKHTRDALTPGGLFVFSVDLLDSFSFSSERAQADGFSPHKAETATAARSRAEVVEKADRGNVARKVGRRRFITANGGSADDGKGNGEERYDDSAAASQPPAPSASLPLHVLRSGGDAGVGVEEAQAAAGGWGSDQKKRHRDKAHVKGQRLKPEHHPFTLHPLSGSYVYCPDYLLGLIERYHFAMLSMQPVKSAASLAYSAYMTFVSDDKDGRRGSKYAHIANNGADDGPDPIPRVYSYIFVLRLRHDNEPI